MAHQQETATFTNMIMIQDQQGNVVVEHRRKPGWQGLVFPGGHVEPQELFADSAIREAWEETGLTIAHPTLAGVQQFTHVDGYRYVVFLYKATSFSGELKSSEEGEVCWMPLTELLNRKADMCHNFDKILRVYLEDAISEYGLVQDQEDAEKWVEYFR